MTKKSPTEIKPSIIKWAVLIILLLCLLWLLSNNGIFGNNKSLFDASATDTIKPASSIIPSKLPNYIIEQFGKPPTVYGGSLNKNVQGALNTIFGDNHEPIRWDEKRLNALSVLTQSKDPRLAWIISDFMRMTTSREFLLMLSDAASQLLNFTPDKADIWADTTDHLIAWDIPAPPNYLRFKKHIYTLIDPRWNKIFTEGDINWRHVSWGGVGIDNRQFGQTNKPCNCIPAVDNPEVTDVAGAAWLNDKDIIFGLAINGEARAYPRRIMEVREMVNDTLGGRDLGIPYCTLCGSAQAYFTDAMPEGVKRPVLRTSGLLIRSNKVMYDLNTYSVFDTFRGHAVTGPLAKQNISLKQASVVITEWGEWKKAHPNTTVLKQSLAMGANFDFRNNRDAKGPIFPVGNIDPRLPAQDDIVGLITDSDIPIAFHKAKALAALKQGDNINYENIILILDGGGIKAVNKDGKDLGSHEAFWFAWSQFHPDTKLWPNEIADK